MSGRIRSIKPEWLDDERLVLAPDAARVLSVALLLLADDEGRGPANPALLGGRVFPANPAAAEPALAALRPWFVRLYRARGQTFFEIRNWRKHQRIDKPSPGKAPNPSEGEWIDREDNGARDDSTNPPRILHEDSAGVRASRASTPPPDPLPGPGLISPPDPSRASPPGPGVAPVLRRAPADPLAASFAPPNEFDRWVFDRWVTMLGKTGAVFDARRALCLAERRLAGMTEQDADDALLAASRDEYVTGKKDGKRHDRLVFIFGDADRYEEFRDEGRRLRLGGAPASLVRTRRPTRAGDMLAAQLDRVAQLEAEEAAEEASA